MVIKHEKPENTDSVEKTLSADYIPKSKLGNLPLNSGINDETKKKMDQAQKEIEKYKDEILKKYKFIEAIGLIPAQASKEIEQEYEISKEDSDKGLIHVLTVIPEKYFKDIAKIRIDAINEARKINDKFWVHVMTPVDLWNLGLDSKFQVMEAIGMSYPVMDKGILAAIRVSQIHKSLVLRKFDKYITSYVIAGSMVRGEATKTSDVDIFIVIDDTDVKRMSTLELKDRLRQIIFAYIQDAQAMAGVKNVLNVQTYLLTEFWDAVKDAHPVMFTFIRDGVPLYDRGAFLPWKSLLRMGKIRPSPEAIDMFMSSGNRLKEIVDRRIFDIAVLDLFHGISTPTQGLLMLYGQAPGTIQETVKSFRETFVEKEKLVEKEYADILEEISIKYYKGYEHGKVKPGDIDGKLLDTLVKKTLKYIERLKTLREQIQKRVQEKSIEETYNDVFGMIGSLLKKKSEEQIIEAFEKEFIKEGKFPLRFLENLKAIAKVRKEANQNKEKRKTEEKKKELTNRQDLEVNRAQKNAVEIINALIEYTQRAELGLLEKSKPYLLKGRDMNAEIFFLQETFVVQGNKIEKVVEGKLKNSNPEELKKQILEHKGKETKIDMKNLELLRKMFGEFELIG